VVKDLAFIAYSVRDVPRAITFYRDVIGLKPGDMFSDKWAEFDVGNTTFATFEVDDFSGMRDQLVAKKVPVTEIMVGEICSSFFVTDPEGNRFGPHHRKAK
jgi:predicted enzyme related to lactoylglutathione lyase